LKVTLKIDIFTDQKEATNMEFKVNSKELEKLLNKIIPAVPSRTPMPILENFLFEIKDGSLTIYATDLEISLKSSLNIVAEENLKIVVPARLLYDVVKSLKDTTIQFKVGPNGKLNLKTDSGKYTLSYLDPDEFPEIPTVQGDMNNVILNGADLKYAFDKTSFAMSKEEMRPAMMGTLFEFSEEGLRFVTTDGHRLVNLLLNKKESPAKEQYVVPERAVSVLNKILDDKDVNIYISKTHMSFILSDMELITRLISQKYPDYSAVIPYENEIEMKIKTKEMNEVIKRMMLFSSSNTRRVKFSLKKDNVLISAEDVDLGAAGEETITAEYDGADMEIGFNSSYVNDVLSHLTQEEDIVFKLHSPTKAVVIRPVKDKENQELLMLLMPVRLNS
jgi:DNA polymerase-3 subunit beta